MNSNNLQDLKQQITYLIGNIKDPQKNYLTLLDLGVIHENSVKVREIKKQQVTINNSQIEKHKLKSLKDNQKGYIKIEIQIIPTVPHCHLIQQIGLLIRYQLRKQLENQNEYKFHIYCRKGTHNQAEIVEKQINDKERILAAFQNPDIINFLQKLTNIT